MRNTHIFTKRPEKSEKQRDRDTGSIFPMSVPGGPLPPNPSAGHLYGPAVDERAFFPAFLSLVPSYISASATVQIYFQSESESVLPADVS